MMSLSIGSLKRKELQCLVWHLKAISSLLQFKTPFYVFCSLVLVCKDIIPKYERTTSKRFFSTFGTFSLTRWALFKNFFKKCVNKVFRVTILLKYPFQKN